MSKNKNPGNVSQTSAVENLPAVQAPASIVPSGKLSREELIRLASSSTEIFENTKVGENFGGSYTRLELGEGEVSAVFTYVKEAKIPVEKENFVNGAKQITTELKTMQILEKADGSSPELFSTPISSIFQKHWTEASVREGDVVQIKRYPDAIKKRGLGMGNKMQVYAIKLLFRNIPAVAQS